MKFSFESSFHKIIEHTYLKTERQGDSPSVQRENIHRLVVEAHGAEAYAVCVRENQVALAKRELVERGSLVKLVTVIGFPVGDEFSSQQKIDLFHQTLLDGADEFDMVFNYKQFQKGQRDQVFQDMVKVSQVVGGRVLKVIFENACLSSEQEKIEAYTLAKQAFAASVPSSSPSYFHRGLRFFKTSTGFASVSSGTPVGATVEDVVLMKKIAGNEIGIKPSGGIHSLEFAKNLFEAVGLPCDPVLGGIDASLFRIGSSSLLTQRK